MIKLLSLGMLPLVVAFVYGQRLSEPLISSSFREAEADRIFLAQMESQETAAREQIESAQRAAALKLQACAPVPVAVPVAVAVATPFPVRRAIPIPKSAGPQTSIAFGGTALRGQNAGTEKPERAGSPSPEGTAPNPEPEVRRAIPISAPHASIFIFRDDVVISPALHRFAN
jgi:hypothetical protein